jgi:heat shock protein HslJ
MNFWQDHGMHRVRTPSYLVLVAAAGLLLLGACGDEDEPPPAVSQSGASLEGTTWLLDTGALGGDYSPDVTSTLRLLSGQANGSGGCNLFTGTYTLDGRDLSFGPLASTRRACGEAETLVEKAVFDRLAQVQTFSVDGEQLRLADSGGTTVLTYDANEPTIEGSWEVLSVLYDDAIRSVVVGTDLTATFTAAGEISGLAGCNRFTGGYTVEGADVHIDPLARTAMACAEPEGIMEQEDGYLAALESVVRFEQVADELTLFNAEGQMAVTLTRAG